MENTKHRFIVTNRPDHFVRLDLHHDFLSAEQAVAMLAYTGATQYAEQRAVDLETTALSAKLGVMWCAQFGVPPSAAWPEGVQIIVDTEIPNIPGMWEPVDITLFRELLEDPRIVWVGHNLAFDLTWLLMDHDIRILHVYDTFIASKVIHAGKKWEREYVSLLVTPEQFEAQQIKKRRADTKRNFMAELEQAVLRGEMTAAQADTSLEEQGFDKLEADEMPAPKMSFFLHNLAAVQKRELGYTHLDKDVRSEVMKKGINTPETLDYSFRDVDKDLFALVDALRLKAHNLGMTVAVQEEMDFVPVSAWIEYNGFPISPEHWMAKVAKNEAARDNAESELVRQLREDHPELHETMEYINWGSPQQMIQLFRAIGVDVSNPKKEGSYTANIKLLKKQQDKFPIIKPYIAFSEARKQCSTYGREWATPVMRPLDKPESTYGYLFAGNRIHTKMKQLGAATGRISSGGMKSQSSEGKEVVMPFPNIANIPRDKETRACFRAPNGRTMVTADYSGQESVIFADWTGARKLLEFYEKDGSDMHSYIARMLFDEIPNDMDLADVKKTYPEQRQLAKSVGFAIAYGGSGHTIAANADIPLEKAEKIYNKYMSSFPDVAIHFEKVQAKALEDGYILACAYSGRRRWLDGWEDWKKRDAEKKALVGNRGQPVSWDDYRWHKSENSDYYQAVLKPLVSTNFKVEALFRRQALNTPSQAAGSEMMKRSLVLFYERVRRNKTRLNGGVKLVNDVYDEAVVECSKANVAWTEKNLQECMELASTYNLNTIPKVKANPVSLPYWDH